MCSTPRYIKDTLYTQSLEGLNLHVKTHCLNSYTFVCENPHTCYSCKTAS